MPVSRPDGEEVKALVHENGTSPLVRPTWDSSAPAGVVGLLENAGGKATRLGVDAYGSAEATLREGATTLSVQSAPFSVASPHAAAGLSNNGFIVQITIGTDSAGYIRIKIHNPSNSPTVTRLAYGAGINPLTTYVLADHIVNPTINVPPDHANVTVAPLWFKPGNTLTPNTICGVDRGTAPLGGGTVFHTIANNPGMNELPTQLQWPIYPGATYGVTVNFPSAGTFRFFAIFYEHPIDMYEDY